MSYLMFFCLLPVFYSSSEKQYNYRAAISLYTDKGTFHNTPAENIALNLNAFSSHAKKLAKQNVDVLVFPETVLWGKGFSGPNPRETMRQYGEEFPDVGETQFNPCIDMSIASLPILRNTSCIAHDNAMVIVINVIDIQPCDHLSDPNCPSDGRYQFNTDIAFDRDGTYQAKYHKSHIFSTHPILDQPLKPNVVTFQPKPMEGRSDLPLFGLFICYDIEFSQPAQELRSKGILDILFSSSWANNAPFMSAQMFQQSWSRQFDSNLIAANNGMYGGAGGIYSAGLPLTQYFDPSLRNVDKVLFADVQSPPLVYKTQNYPLDDNLIFKEANILSNIHNNDTVDMCLITRQGSPAPCVLFNTTVDHHILSVTSSSGSLTCHLNVSIIPNIDDIHSINYALQAMEQTLNFPGTPDPLHVESCAIFQCSSGTDHVSSDTVCKSLLTSNTIFDSLVLTGTGFHEDTKFFPMVAIGDEKIATPSLINFMVKNNSAIIRLENNAYINTADKLPQYVFSTIIYGLRNKNNQIKQTKT